jgi:Tfp pilus assembly protein PilV
MALNERGMSFVEALLAMAILAIAATTLLGAFVALVHTSTFTEERSKAIPASQQILEALRHEDPGSLPVSGSSSVQTVAVGTDEFQAIVHYCRNAAFCTATSRHVTVDIFFGGTKVYDVETVFTRLE